jgi:cytochrome c556
MRNNIVFWFGLILLSNITTICYAAPKTEDQIKFRQSAMMLLRWNMGAIKNQVLTNPQNFNKDKVVASARVIAAISNSGLETLFTSQSSTGKGWIKTKVKSGYFEQTDDVKKRYAKFSREANQLLDVANSKDVTSIKHQFQALLDTCKGCHKKYRNKKLW